MRIDHASVLHVTELARLEPSEAQLSELTGCMSEMLDYVAQLERLDLAAIEPTSHALELAGELRADAERPGVGAELALSNAPDSARGMYRVPRIIGE